MADEPVALWRVTIDTNNLRPPQFTEIELAASGLPIELDHVTVSDREKGRPSEPPPPAGVAETWLLGRSPFPVALGSDNSQANFFDILAIIRDRVVTPVELARPQSAGEERQIRDAQIFEAHVRARRDIFLTEDRTGFVNHGRREAIEARYNTRVMTRTEFLKWCCELRRPQ